MHEVHTISRLPQNYPAQTRCPICTNTFQPNEKYVVHTNPLVFYRIVTRSLRQFTHPIHEKCWEWIKTHLEPSERLCPWNECREHIGEPGTQSALQEGAANASPLERTIPIPEHPLFKSCSLATLGAIVASVASGASFTQILSTSFVTFLAGKTLTRQNLDTKSYLPIAAICNAATIGGLNNMEWTVATLFSATLGALFGVEAINAPIERLIREETTQIEMLFGSGFCLVVATMLPQLETYAQITQVALRAAAGGIVATGLIKIMDAFDRYSSSR